MYPKPYDIIGYTYKADIYCPACAVRAVGDDYRFNLPRVIYDHEAALHDLAHRLGIDWQEEYCARCSGELD
jgi:hypothetical protein